MYVTVVKSSVDCRLKYLSYLELITSMGFNESNSQ